MNGIMKKKIKSLEESNLLMKDVCETTKNALNEKKTDFSACYQVHQVLVYPLTGNLLTGKGTIRAGEGTIRFSIPPHPLTNFEIQKYYQE